MKLPSVTIWLALMLFIGVAHSNERDGSFRLTPGTYLPAELIDQTFTEGNIVTEDKILILNGGGRTNLPRMGIRLADECLNKYYKITVAAYGNGRSAQIMLTEGFRWNVEPVLRFWRTRLEKADDFMETTVFLHAEQLPFFLNFGLLPNDSPELFMKVKSLVMEEIDETTYRKNVGHSEIQVPDRPRNVNVLQALNRFTENAQRLLAADFMPAELKSILAEKVAKRQTIAWNGEHIIPDEVEEFLSESERLGVMMAQKLVPEAITLPTQPLQLAIYNLHSPHSVWARLEADAPGVEYRLVLKSGAKYRLNQGNLALIPAYEPAVIEITGLSQNNRLKIFPLDHHGKDTVTELVVK